MSPTFEQSLHQTFSSEIATDRNTDSISTESIEIACVISITTVFSLKSCSVHQRDIRQIGHDVINGSKFKCYNSHKKKLILKPNLPVLKTSHNFNSSGVLVSSPPLFSFVLILLKRSTFAFVPWRCCS